MSLEPITIDSKTFFRKDYILPPLPEMLLQIKREVMSEESNANQVARLVAADPALVAQVLRVVNSAYYSLPREVADIRFAVAFIGLNEVYRIVLAVSVIDSLKLDDEKALKSFWTHSYFTAVCCKFLAKKMEPHLAQDELWSAALLHDIGSLIYVKFFPEHYRAIQIYSEEHGCLPLEAENALNLPHSSLLGSLLAEHWQLPLAIRQACENHDIEELENLTEYGKNSAFAKIICLACLISSLITRPLLAEKKQKIGASIKHALNYSEEAFLELMAEIYDLKDEADQFTSQMI